jgi:hypothetical protein
MVGYSRWGCGYVESGLCLGQQTTDGGGWEEAQGHLVRIGDESTLGVFLDCGDDVVVRRDRLHYGRLGGLGSGAGAQGCRQAQCRLS